MNEREGTVIRINDYGLCELAAGNRRVSFTLDKLPNYHGESLRGLGLRVGTKVAFTSDLKGRVHSARVLHADAASS